MELRVTHLSRVCRQLSLFALALSLPAFAQQVPSPAQNLNMGFPVPQTLETRIAPTTVELHPRVVTLGPESTFGSFYMQSDLKLGRAFDFVLDFSLRANTPDAKSKKVPDGWYLMTLAVVYKDTSQLLNWPKVKTPYQRLVTASAPTPVQVINGEPVRKPSITLRFDNLTAIAVQHELYFELLPLDNRCGNQACVRVLPDGTPDMENSDVSRLLKGHRPYRALMSVIPFLPKFSAVTELEKKPNLLEAGQTVAAFVMKARAWQLEQRVNVRPKTLSPREYARAAGLYYVDLNDPELDKVSRDYLKGPGLRERLRGLMEVEGSGTLTLAKGHAKLMPALCAMLASRNRTTVPIDDIMDHIRYCGSLWRNSVYLSRVTHVGKVDRSEGKKIGFFMNSQFNYQVSLNFIRARSRSRDLVSTVAIKPLGFASKALDMAGVFNPTGAFDWSWTVSESNSQQKVEQNLTSASDFMHFDPTGVVIPTSGTRKCILVSVDKLAYPFFDPDPKARNGLYICDGQPRDQDVREIYAHLFTYPQQSSTVDAFDPGTQAMNQSFRGDRDLAQTLYQIRTALKPVHGPEIFPSAPAVAAERYFNNTHSINDMLIVNPIAFEKDWIPSTGQMLSRDYRETFFEERAR